MNMDICKKCRHWREYCGLYTENRTAKLWMGCTMPDGSYSEIVLRGKNYNLIKNEIRGNYKGRKGKAPCGCYNGSPTFDSISGLVKDEYDALRKEVVEAPVAEECPYLTEQKMEEWNNG